MNDVVIRVENLSKVYRIGLAEQRYETLVGAISSYLRSPLRNFSNLRKLSSFNELKAHETRGNRAAATFPETSSISDSRNFSDVIWALRDVSFEVKRGEVLGIIGRNGAGKSTLLKILARITEPSSGRAEMHGRVGSLLEVGTGFHPDLTGRENVYLNGTILGMKKREIDNRLSEIVEFSGVEKFIDTPVKRYSSGMRVRLAFSVAAHLHPEILLVDEVLAVGDAEFQKKCLGKIGQVALAGRTVLFVSHNMTAVESLCQHALLIQDGRLAAEAGVTEIIARYFDQGVGIRTDVDLVSRPSVHCPRDPIIRRFRITDVSGDPMESLRLGGDVRFEVHLQSSSVLHDVRLAIRIFDSGGQRITTCHSAYQFRHAIHIVGEKVISCVMKNCRMRPGRYSIVLQLDVGRDTIDRVESGLFLEVVPGDLYGTGKLLPANAALLLPEVDWQVDPLGGR